MRENRKILKNDTLLILLCWIVYTCSYLGKLGYSANIAQIEEKFAVSHSAAGLVGTLFFFAYGVGQIVNGILCKKYNIRLVVFFCLLVSGLMNILVAIMKDFNYIKYFWLINGASLSILWPSLIRLLSETLDKGSISKAVVVMGTTVAVGTVFVYGLSALFEAVLYFEIMFFVAGILLPIIAIIWFVSLPRLTSNRCSSNVEEQVAIPKDAEKPNGLLLAICMFALFGIIVNLVKDGLTTWIPVILKEIFGLPDYINILLTLVLPFLAVFGTAVAVLLNKKIKDFVLLSASLFFVSALFIGLVIIFLPTSSIIVVLSSFGIVSCLMSGVNNIVTSMVPLYWKERINSGFIAGLLNGFCYLGSTISAYGLGFLADVSGWGTVLSLLCILCFSVTVIAVLYFIVGHIKTSQQK